MIYKKHKKSSFIISALAALILLSIPFGKQYYRNMYLSLYDKLLTYDTGFSSIHTYFGYGSVSNLSNYPNAIYKLPKVAKNILWGSENNNEFERIEINIKFKNYLKLLEDRTNAVKNGVGFDFREVNAKLKFNDEEFDAKIRLKGDLDDHWRSLNKMSLRISLEGDSYIMGFKKFSIHKPSARQHPYDQLFHELQRGLGNTASENNYVDVYVNGEKWGIMNIEEHISKEFLERKGLKESIVLKFENDKMWRYSKMSKNYYSEYNLSDERFHINVYGSQEYLSQDIYRKWYSYIARENLKENIELYDNDSFTKSMLLSLAWNSSHALGPSNSKFYFNPYSLRLEPITNDQSLFSELNYKVELPLFYNILIGSSLFKDRFDKNYNLVKNILQDAQESMDYWQSFFPFDEKIKTDILTENLEKVVVNLNDYIYFKEKSFDSEIKISEEQSKDLVDHIYARHFENGEIHIYNLINEDVVINSIKVDGDNIQDIENIKYVSAKSNYSPTILSTDLIGIFDNRISIETQHNTNVRSYTLDYTHLVNKINNPLINKSNMRDYNFIQKVSESNYQVKIGDWNIYEPIIIDGNLEINENTSLNFNENAYMIIKGSARIIGSKGKEVVLKPLKKSWKGLYVFEADSKSIFKNVIISGMTFLNDGLLSLTGGINFYKSDVDISDSKFINSTAEDALNIVKSNFNFNNVEFDSAISDAFDSDFSNGSIKNSLFKNINGDAIDFSGSFVEINDSKFINIRDKAVSSGEASNLSLENLEIANVGVGIASKDGSITNAQNIDIRNFILKAVMSYNKKDFYNNPEFYGKNIITDNTKNAFARQVKTIMEVNGNLIREELINIDDMYEGEIMKKQ